MFSHLSLQLIPLMGMLCLAIILIYLLTLLLSQLRQMTALERLQRQQLQHMQQRTQRRLSAIDMEQLDQRGAWRGLRRFKLQRKVLEDHAQSICSFYLVPHDGRPLLPFRAGQFLTFHLNIPGQSETVRCYSLSHAANQNDYYRVSIKKIPAPKDHPELPPGVSSNYFHQLKEGDCLNVEAPAGDFYLDTESEQPVILIGGGIGITPVYSMLEQIAHNQPNRETWFFYGIRNSSEHIWKDALEKLAQAANINLVICYSNPTEQDLKEGGDNFTKGRVSVSLIKEQLQERGNNYQFYLCGPPPMMRSLIHDLGEWGVSDEQVHYEAFGPASIVPDSQAQRDKSESSQQSQDYTIEFNQSEKSFTWDGSDKNLWDFAQKNGLVLPKGCGAGNCGQCQTMIHKGEVEYPHKPSKRVEKNACLTCCAIPSGDLVLEA